MITLKYRIYNQNVIEWISRLEEMVVKFKVEEDEIIQQPLVIEGDTIFQGSAEIDNYLDQLERDLERWRACACGQSNEV